MRLRLLRSELPEFFLGQTGLFENRAKSSAQNVTRMHGDISLAAIRMAQDDV